MKNNIIPYQKYEFKANKTYFFDNNIWIALFAPFINTNEERQHKASNFIERIQSFNSEIIVTSLIVSEFANTYLRASFELWKKGTMNPLANYKKDYKKTDDYQDNLTLAKRSIEKIIGLDFVAKYPDDFNSIDMSSIIDNFQIDFNDAYYLELCYKNKWDLVTSDSDFDTIDKGITIIKI